MQPVLRSILRVKTGHKTPASGWGARFLMNMPVTQGCQGLPSSSKCSEGVNDREKAHLPACIL